MLVVLVDEPEGTVLRERHSLVGDGGLSATSFLP